MERAEIQELYQQLIYWEQEIGTTPAFSQTATQSTAIVETKIGSVESGSPLMNKARREGVYHLSQVWTFGKIKIIHKVGVDL